MKYTSADVAKFRKYNDVTPNGVAFDWSLISAEGACFCLVREAQHTDEIIEDAKAYLRRERDVVALRVCTMQTGRTA